jgi:hypothetical protein
VADKNDQGIKSDDSNAKQKYDFSGVNLATGEGMQQSFSSVEEMDEYIHAFNEECEKAGITL